ncbi:MAG: FHA domain-containing protein [Kofleriaceae bacterium]|nr:FHA domain-containing protein [Kofleriaceae bacterium]
MNRRSNQTGGPVSAHVVPRAQVAPIHPQEEERTSIDGGPMPEWEEASTVEGATSAAGKAFVDGNVTQSSTTGRTIDEPTMEDPGKLMMTPGVPGLPAAGMGLGLEASEERLTATGKLVVTAGTDAGREFEVIATPGKPVSVGRAIDNDVVLTDISVSRKHFELSYQDDRWVLRDRGSGNGTMINERVEEGTCPLRHGDVIEIGNTTFRFDHPPSAQAALSPWGQDDDDASTVAGKPMREPPRPGAVGGGLAAAMAAGGGPTVGNQPVTTLPGTPGGPRARAATVPPAVRRPASSSAPPPMRGPTSGAGDRMAAPVPAQHQPPPLAPAPLAAAMPAPLMPRPAPPPSVLGYPMVPTLQTEAAPPGEPPPPEPPRGSSPATTMQGVSAPVQINPGYPVMRPSMMPGALAAASAPTAMALAVPVAAPMLYPRPKVPWRAGLLAVALIAIGGGAALATKAGPAGPASPKLPESPVLAIRAYALALMGRGDATTPAVTPGGADADAGAGTTPGAAATTPAAGAAGATITVAAIDPGTGSGAGAGTAAPGDPAADKAAADRLAADKLAADKTAADKTAADKTAADKLAADKSAADKLAADRLAADKLAADRLAADKLAADKTAADKLAADKSAADRAAADKLAADKSAADRAAADKLAADRAAAAKIAAADKAATAADKAAERRREAEERARLAEERRLRDKERATGQDTSGAEAEAKQQYADGDYRAAAATLNAAAAKSPSGKAEELRKRAANYKQVGDGLTAGRTQGSSKATEALSKLQQALAADERSGGAHREEIRGLIATVAPQAAVAYMGRVPADAERAFAATEAATKAGAGSASAVKAVRFKLEKMATEMIGKAQAAKGSNPGEARGLLERVKKIVTRDSPNYGKATSLLSSL